MEKGTIINNWKLLAFGIVPLGYSVCVGGESEAISKQHLPVDSEWCLQCYHLHTTFSVTDLAPDSCLTSTQPEKDFHPHLEANCGRLTAQRAPTLTPPAIIRVSSSFKCITDISPCWQSWHPISSTCTRYTTHSKSMAMLKPKPLRFENTSLLLFLPYTSDLGIRQQDITMYYKVLQDITMHYKVLLAFVPTFAAAFQGRLWNKEVQGRKEGRG